MSRHISVTKGHGTRNDFLLIDGRSPHPELTPELIAALCDRRSGLGADGIIRLVSSVSEPDATESLAANPQAKWFMDYRNADGSIAQMCGNGVRVFAAFAQHLNLWPDDDAPLAVATRAGVREVTRVADSPDWFRVDMGQWKLPGGETARTKGSDAEVITPGLKGIRRALRVDMGNPHAVVALGSPAELATVDLAAEPAVSPLIPGGTNVEYVVPLGQFATPEGQQAGRVRMRVYERGVGETESCGTGACAAALAVYTWSPDASAPTDWVVEVPGGSLTVQITSERTYLSGPAVLTATAEVDLEAI